MKEEDLVKKRLCKNVSSGFLEAGIFTDSMFQICVMAMENVRLLKARCPQNQNCQSDGLKPSAIQLTIHTCDNVTEMFLGIFLYQQALPSGGCIKMFCWQPK
jgi:hypothetical protein